MITLKRASAGSGKTYSLTKMYLKLLLGIKENGKWRLRRNRGKHREILDVHSHLLAITFTNKATAEMRNRFILGLSRLANPKDKKTPYLSDFEEELHASASEIRAVARETLYQILNHYSDFQVSTIDSFFQQILRSFAYEVELPDNYDVELDTTLVIAAALDALFATAINNPHSEEAFWTQKYMSMLQKNGQKWNLSQHSGKSYSDLLDYLEMIEKEKFKNELKALEEYFASQKDLRGLEAAVKNQGDIFLTENAEAAKQTAEEFLRLATEKGIDKQIYSHLRKRIDAVLATPANELPDVTLTPYKTLINKKGLEKLSSADELLKFKELDETLLQQCLAWTNINNYVACMTNAVPVLALIHLLLGYIQNYTVSNNIVQLADTNTILQKINQGSDVPFIYEKIGTVLESYMIDEFQDTSLLQWVNMKPLIDESKSNENMIIGDAKQSIYRFRNADSTLITSKVPQLYSGRDLEITGDTAGNNINYRSAPAIVQFNNAMFRYLASHYADNKTAVADIEATYKGLEQIPHCEDLQGYVEINQEETSEMTYLGPLIVELIGRGYYQKDIAVLVRSHTDGTKAIRAITEYNRNALNEDADFTPIEVISDESLIIKNGHSIQTIVTMLQAIKSEGSRTESPEGYSKLVNDFIDSIHRLSVGNPQATTAELINMYFAGSTAAQDAGSILAGDTSLTLGAMVERIIATFVPEEERRLEARYISAFQDVVSNFCETHQADVASFLNYWEDKQYKLAIASPQDANAVQILTIHKSKGLERRCIILPAMNGRTTIKGGPGEMVWFHPGADFAHIMPKLVPAKINSADDFAGTPWETPVNDIESEQCLDALNLAYVAFTRAKDELYVYISAKPADKGIGKAITEIKSAEDLKLPGLIMADEGEFDGFEEGGEAGDDDDIEAKLLFSFGARPDRDYVLKRNEKENSDKPKEEEMVLESYRVNINLPEIKYAPEEESPFSGDNEAETNKRLDKITREALKSLVSGNNPDDSISRFLLRAEVRGFISANERQRLQKAMLSELHSNRYAAAWFGPDNKVLEPHSLYDRAKVYTADLMVVDPSNKAAVIDIATDSDDINHEIRVRGYASRLQKTGRYAHIEGYVWHPASGSVNEVWH